MKRTLLALVIISFSHIANAQLANTSWTGTINAGGENINAFWKLTADSSYFYSSDDNSLLDVSVFKVKDSTFTIKKVSGLNSCSEAEGVYTFSLKDNKLTFYLSKDECYDRSSALDKVVFTKQ